MMDYYLYCITSNNPLKLYKKLAKRFKMPITSPKSVCKLEVLNCWKTKEIQMIWISILLVIDYLFIYPALILGIGF